MSGMFCMSSSCTRITPRRYMQCSHRILSQEPTSAGGSCTIVWKSPTAHGESISLLKPSSPGKLFSIHATVMYGLMKTCILRVPIGFRNNTVWIFRQGSWMDVWLGHTFFHQISQVPPTCDSLHGLLEDVPLHMHQNMWFQHDGTPPHFSFAVQDNLDQRFGQQWIGRGGPTVWPTSSPDLTPLDYYLWGHMKSMIYEAPVASEEDLLVQVMAAGIRESNMCCGILHVAGKRCISRHEFLC